MSAYSINTLRGHALKGLALLRSSHADVIALVGFRRLCGSSSSLSMLLSQKLAQQHSHLRSDWPCVVMCALAEFLGEDMIKDKGLNCKLIIAKKVVACTCRCEYAFHCFVLSWFWQCLLLVEFDLCFVHFGARSHVSA